MPPEPIKESDETACNIADPTAISDGDGAGKADEVSKDRGEQAMMYGDRAETIAIIVLIVLLAIIGAVIYEALTK